MAIDQTSGDKRVEEDGVPSQTLPDLLALHLKVVFCGINPGLRAAAEGHHFAGRSNRFWRVLHQAGYTPHQISPESDGSILQYGYGLTTAVERATVRADELAVSEFAAASQSLERKITAYRPRYIAFLGKSAYSALSGQRELKWGSQPATFGGARVWVLPNPSGLNRSFNLADLTLAYRELLVALNLNETQ